MTARDPLHDRRQRRWLVAIGMLFFAPLGAAFYLYYGPAAWHPGHLVNHGDLIDPPRPVPDVPLASAHAPAGGRLEFKRKWTLLYLGAGACSARCRVDLYDMRQVRIALNRDMDRVQRVFIAEGECCDWSFLESQHPDLITVLAAPATASLIELLPRYDGIAPAAADRVYLIDPLGNLMMSYAPEAKPKGMLQDVKRLLGLSHVG